MPRKLRHDGAQAQDRLAPLEPWLDYPAPGESITGEQYTLRVGAAADVESAEVSINGGPWQACRPAIGYWWFDWSGYEGGKHRLVARVRTRDGAIHETLPRLCQVKRPH